MLQARSPTVALEHAALRFVLLSASFVPIYALANQWSSSRHAAGRAIADGVFAWERSIPFVAWTIVPYLSICLFFALSFFVGRDRAALDRHALRLALLLLLSVACYALVPLRFTFDRPAVDGALGALFSLLWHVDLPYNRAPSLHIGMLVLLWVRFEPLVRGLLRRALQLWFGLIALSVLTTYQHHAIDIPAGVLAAVASIVCSRLTWKPHPVP